MVLQVVCIWCYVLSVGVVKDDDDDNNGDDVDVGGVSCVKTSCFHFQSSLHHVCVSQ